MRTKAILTFLTLFISLVGIRRVSAQGYSVVLNKLDNLEAKINKLEVAQKGETKKLREHLTNGDSEFESSNRDSTIASLQSRTDVLAVNLEYLRSETNKVDDAAETFRSIAADLSELVELLRNGNGIRLSAGSEESESEYNTSVPTQEASFSSVNNGFFIRGIDLEMAYISDVFSNVVGGIERKTGYLHNIDITATIDMEEVMDWKNATGFIYVLGNHGADPSEFVGDAQVASNIEAPDSWRIYEAWIEQKLFGDRLTVKAGLYDLNSEFDVIETAGLFMNSSHGIGPDFSQSGLNGPSIFPITSAGLRLRWQTTGSTYLQVVALDGVSGHPDNPYGTQIIFQKGDGMLLATEMGYQTGGEESEVPYGKIAVGAWRYTSDFECFIAQDEEGNAITSDGNQGVYILAERSIFQGKDDPSNNIAIFGRYGIANSDINQFDSYLGAGVVFSGFFGREEDQLGLAVASAHNGAKFKQCMGMSGFSIDDAETVLEFTYRTRLFPWLVIQPDMQYIINPGTNQELKNALLVGARFEVSF